MKRISIRRVVTAVALLVAFVCQGTWALAGTTGGLTGNVLEADNTSPVAGAVVTVSSPSQNATGTTDATGRFTFLTLAPDTYTVTVTKSGYQPVSTPGQVVFADSVQSLSVRLPKSLQTIAHVAATSAGSLVKSGTTADVYSVNAATQSAAAALGGGGSLNSAYSAIAAVPGAYVIPNQTGYYQTVHIRGGDYDQVGYEFDGVPVNRSFDNYPSSSASSLGNAEVQVYTGATPAGSEGQGLAGYINQVIKTGTYPGYATATLGIGNPTFYHRAAVEVGGATPDRLFSYYVGVGGYHQEVRYLDNQNGAGYDNWQGTPLSAQPCANPSACPWAGGAYYPIGTFQWGAIASIDSRDTVANLHLAIPHRNDAGRDDVQLLWDSSYLMNGVYVSTNDIASTSCSGAAAASGAACANAIGLGQPFYIDGYQWNCPVGGTVSNSPATQACVSRYYFPGSQNRTTPLENIPVSQRDTVQNNQEIFKLQYTKNLGSSAFLRLYGYTYYSNWIYWSPVSAYINFNGLGIGGGPFDYELSSHTRGLSLQFQDQINSANLVSLQGSYVTANSIRDNNTQVYNLVGVRGRAFVAVNGNNPYNGICYNVAASGGASTATSCDPQAGLVTATFGTWSQAQSGTLPSVSASRCGTGPCELLNEENSQWATYNAVKPEFGSLSLTDEFRPNDKWLFNLGVRLDSFTFRGDDTNMGPARQFWFNAYNQAMCLNNASGAPFDKVAQLGIAVTAACPSGYHAVNLQNTSNQNFTFNVWQPRIGGTYTVNPDNVVRFSFGRYTQAPNAAFEQYNTLQEDLPFSLLGTNLAQYGRFTPGQAIYPPTSINYDLSWEHHLKGTDWSFKMTPFLRQTQNQIQQFFLNQATGFVSGLNVGSQRSQGVEFQLQKGDFSHNGLSGMLSFAYTNSYIKYGKLSNGLTIINPINATIAGYNAYTKACAPGGKYAGKTLYGQALCGSTSNGQPAAPCYTTAGIAVATCTAADVGNPYWNAPQSLIDPGQQFPTYTIFPGGVGTSGGAYGSPYVATLLLNYKRDRLTITPTFQFQGGGKYGSPLSNIGIDPAACAGVLPVSGANGGGRYDSTVCGTLAAIPNTYTGSFDNLGSYTQPNEFVMNLQLGYDLSPRVTLTGTLANIVNTCWGGSQEPWNFGDHNVCSYGIVAAGAIAPLGNVYNPAGFSGSVVQPFLKYPYGPGFGPFNTNGNSTKNPFQFYVTAKIKI